MWMMEYSVEHRDFLLNVISNRAHSEMGLDVLSVKYLTTIEHRYRKLDLEEVSKSDKASFSETMRGIYSTSKKVADALVPLEGR